MRRSFAGVTAVAAALTAHAAGGTAVVAESVACDVAAIQAKAPPGTTITAAAMVDAAEGRPRFCQVDGHAASTGNTVNFQLGLPESWNGKFLFLGVGGLGGSLAKLDPGLARGYATATTDTGHRASEPDWASNRAKEIDYGYRGTHVSTVATKALTASLLRRPAKVRLLRRMLERRPPGADGSAALSRRFRRRDRRTPRDWHTHAGWPRGRVSADAGVARRVLDAVGHRAGVEGQPRGVRQSRRVGRRAGQRSASLPFRPLGAGVSRRGDRWLPDAGPGRDGRADLSRREDAGRSDLRARIPSGP